MPLSRLIKGKKSEDIITSIRNESDITEDVTFIERIRKYYQ